MKCKYCGTELVDEGKFCRECGNTVGDSCQKRFCRECGAELSDNVKFCSNCGGSVNAEPQNISENDSIDVSKTDEMKKSGDLCSEREIENDVNRNTATENNSLTDKIKMRAKQTWSEMDGFCKVLTIACAVFALMFVVAIVSHKFLPIVISIIQFVGVVVAFLIHREDIKISKTWVKYIVMGIAVLLTIFNIKCYSIGTKSDIDLSEIDSESDESGGDSVQVPIGLDECLEEDYLDIETTLSECGFTNIYLEEIEDLKASESDKVGQIETISIGGRTDFSKNQTFDSNAEIVINYHTYAKCMVKVHINFVPNLMFSKYDVEFKFNGLSHGIISHGEDADYELAVEPGEYMVEFVNEESPSVKGETMLEVSGDTNVSYKISCYSDKISVEVEYTENLGEVDENEVMMTSNASDYEYRNYKDVETELKQLGFKNITTKILYDIELGWTEEGETETVSVGGKKDFKRGDIFSNSDEVVITYHMKEEDDPNKEQEKSTEAKEEEEEDELDEEPVFYSTNNYETAKNGNSGVFSYKKPGSSYDIYYIIDFEEGYVYYFTEGNGEEFCDRLKIESGTLNDSMIITYHDGNDTWSYNLHFKYVNAPETLVMVDNNGFDYEYKTTSLDSAMELRDTKTIKDY